MMKVAEFSIKKSILVGLLMVLPLWAQAQLPAALEQGFASARAAYERGDAARSERLYRALLKDYPKLPELYNNLAITLIAQGKSQQAIDVLQSGLRSHDGFASLYDNLLNVNASISRQQYMQALVPLQNEKPKLKEVALTDLGEVYYAQPAPLQVAMVEKTPPAKATPKVQTTVKPKAPTPAPVQIKPEVEKLAEAPRPTVAPAEPLADNVPPLMGLEVQLKSVLQAWAEAWSRKDLQAYVNGYVKGYRPDQTMSHAHWLKQREQRLRRPKWIKVQLDEMAFFELDKDRVAVQLRQSYQSNRYQDVGRKELLLQRQDGQWKILQERSL